MGFLAGIPAAVSGFFGGAGAAAPVVASGAAFPSGAGSTLLGSAKVGSAAATAGKTSFFTAANAFKAASAIAPVASAFASKPGAPSKPKTITVDREAAEAADRERLKRAQQGSRANILTGPAGAPGSALVGRTVLSGG